MLKKMWCVLDYLLNILQTAVMRFRLSQHYIEIKKCFWSAWNRRSAVWKVPRKKRIPNFRPNSIGGFAVSETKKPQGPKFPIKVSVVLRWAKPKITEPKFSIKSIGGFTVTKTDKRLKKFYGGFSVTSTDNLQR